jgi:hypothetical protein
MTKIANPAERRQFGRRQTNLHAWIEVQGRPRLPCVVKDISVGGALVALEKPHWLPYNFKLCIDSTRFVSWCEVRHQAPGSLGLRFLSAAEAANLVKRQQNGDRSLNDQSAWQGHQR